MYKMNLRIGKFTIFLFSLMLIIGIFHTINYYSFNKQFVINIYAEKEEKKDHDNDNDKDKEGSIQKQTLENKTNAVKEAKKDHYKSKGEDKDKDKDKDKEGSIQKQTLENKTNTELISSSYYQNETTIPSVYETKLNGETYRFNQTNPNDKVQVNKEDKSNVFTKQNIDGSWRIDFGRPRIDIHTKDAGILPDKPSLLNNMPNGKIQSWNFSELKEIGYWYKPSDWKNIEVTLIFKLLDSARSKGEQHSLSLVTRSISHSQLDNEYKKSDHEPKFFCGGSSYHNNISNEGNLRMKKEQFHIDYEWERYNETLTVGNI